MSLELIDGTLVLLVNYGSGTMRIEHKHKKIDDSKPHLIDISLTKTGVEMFVDRCRLSTCMNIGAIVGNNEYLNGKRNFSESLHYRMIAKFYNNFSYFQSTDRFS